MIMYKTLSFHLGTIFEVEVDRITDKSIFIINDGKIIRRSLKPDRIIYHKSWKDAHDHILEQSKLQANRSKLKCEQDLLLIEEIKNMPENTVYKTKHT